jgi:hypothetical protein
LLRRAGIKVAPQQVTAGSDAVQALVGEIAPYQAPKPAAAPSRPHQNAGGQRRRRSGARSRKNDAVRTEHGGSHRSAARSR